MCCRNFIIYIIILLIITDGGEKKKKEEEEKMMMIFLLCIFYYLITILQSEGNVCRSSHFDVRVAEFHSHNDQPPTRKGRTSLK